MDKSVEIDNITNINKQCIVELQYFVGNSDEVIVKELTILDLTTNVTWYFLFKPPYSFKSLNGKAARTNKWLINNFHYIAWNEGYVEYTALENIVKHYCSKFSTIYTTGLKKCEWLRQYTSAVVNMFPLRKSQKCNITYGFCLSIQDTRHAATNCALVKTYRILTAMGEKNLKNGGGEGYISDTEPMTMHEYHSNLRGEHTV